VLSALAVTLVVGAIFLLICLRMAEEYDQLRRDGILGAASLPPEHPEDDRGVDDPVLGGSCETTSETK
jgi:hypothetical protein